MLPQPSNPPCPECGRPGHDDGGVTTSRWVPYREPVSIDAERVVYRQGIRLEGNVRLFCECGHQWTTKRPAHMQPKRPARAKPRRGF